MSAQTAAERAQPKRLTEVSIIAVNARRWPYDWWIDDTPEEVAATHARQRAHEAEYARQWGLS